MTSTQTEMDNVLFMQYWVDEAWYTKHPEDKVLMYRLAARAVQDSDPHQSQVLENIATFFEKRIIEQ